MRPSPLADEIIEEVDDDISKEGGRSPVSNEEEILEFPEDDAMDLDMDLDGMPDLVAPDVVVPDASVVVPDLESNPTVKVTQV